eukprot:scaffold33117_cov44-Prasinocladus_malaysianus.AAC.1
MGRPSTMWSLRNAALEFAVTWPSMRKRYEEPETTRADSLRLQYHMGIGPLKCKTGGTIAASTASSPPKTRTLPWSAQESTRRRQVVRIQERVQLPEVTQSE